MFSLQTPANNKNQISGDVKTLFYLDANGVKLDGLWKLRVNDENAYASNQTMVVANNTSPVYTTSTQNGLVLSNVPGGILQYIGERKIDDWQIQFEVAEFPFFEYIPQYEIDLTPTFPADPLTELTNPGVLVKGGYK